MEFIAIKTSTGLRPAYDDDYEQYAKLKTGEAVKIKVSKVRNLENILFKVFFCEFISLSLCYNCGSTLSN